MKNLSLEKSCSTEELVVEVILEGLKKDLMAEVKSKGDMSLQKDLIVEPDEQIEPNDKELMVTNQMKSCGRTKLEL